MGDVTTRGFKELQGAVDEVAATLPKSMGAAVEDAGNIVAARSRTLVRRRTGRLARGIKPSPVETEGTTVQVRVTYDPSTPYGRFQEKGTRYMTAQAFLEPALEQTATAAVAAIERDLFRALDAVWR